MKKRSIVSLLMAMVCLGGAVGCRGGIDRGDNSITIDETKFQIHVANYYAGLGDSFLQSIKEDFETKYADYTVEGIDKKGVEIVPYNNRNGLDGLSLAESINTRTEEVYFTEDISYRDFVSSQSFHDVTNLVNTPLTEFGESKSILDKLNVTYKNNMSVDGKYYAMPYFDGFYGITYDVDLFEKNLFFFKEGASADNLTNLNDEAALASLFITSLDDKRTTGPDGKTGVIDGIDYSMDDGLPVTYKDFYALMNWMCLWGMQPFIWTGEHLAYVQRFSANLIADYEGVEQTSLNWTFDGVATNLIDSVDQNGNVTFMEPQQITNENGYLLQKQAGRYYALEFIYNIVKNSANYGNSFGSVGHLVAQEEFLRSRFESKKTDICMLIDGSWWENEANAVFEDMQKQPGAKKGVRRLACMPFPKVSRDRVGDPTFINISDSLVFISEAGYEKAKKEGRAELLEIFYRYCHSEYALKRFTQALSMTRPFDYEMNEEDMKTVTNYGKSLYNYHQRNAIIDDSSSNAMWIANQTVFDMETWGFSTVVSGDSYENPFTTFKNFSKVTPKNYFEGLYQSRQSTWESKFSKWF